MYNIQDWNPIRVGNGNHNCPCVYVVPDQYLLDLLARNGSFIAQVSIQGTGIPYDRECLATCKYSKDVFGYRPNYEYNTGYVVFILQQYWNGYPATNGKLTLINVPSHERTIASIPDHMIIPQAYGGVYIDYLLIILVVVLIVICHILLFKKLKLFVHK